MPPELETCAEVSTWTLVAINHANVESGKGVPIRQGLPTRNHTRHEQGPQMVSKSKRGASGMSSTFLGPDDEGSRPDMKRPCASLVLRACRRPMHFLTDGPSLRCSIGIAMGLMHSAAAAIGGMTETEDVLGTKSLTVARMVSDEPTRRHLLSRCSRWEGHPVYFAPRSLPLSFRDRIWREVHEGGGGDRQ
jgi:hypothetical protein